VAAMPTLVLSCEHAVCSVPEWHRERFKNAQDLLTSYRGWDPGALNLAQAFAIKFRTPLTHGEITRLLIDLDLAPDNPQRFGQNLEDLTDDQLRRMNQRYHGAYLDAIRQRIRSGIGVSPPVVHLSVHTFSPESDLAPPDCDIAVLYDPARQNETLLAGTWIAALRAAAPDLAISDNPPGSSGEVLHVLRNEYDPGSYLALRLEVCQAFFLNGAPWRWDKLKKLLLDTFDET
jgi:predicted N-formylglutamate amidohydrolase